MTDLIKDLLATEDKGGQFQPGRYFSGKTSSPFFGISHSFNSNLLFKLEYDSTLTPGLVGYQVPEEDFSFGFDYKLIIILR